MNEIVQVFLKKNSKLYSTLEDFLKAIFLSVLLQFCKFFLRAFIFYISFFDLERKSRHMKLRKFLPKTFWFRKKLMKPVSSGIELHCSGRIEPNRREVANELIYKKVYIHLLWYHAIVIFKFALDLVTYSRWFRKIVISSA